MVKLEGFAKFLILIGVLTMVGVGYLFLDQYNNWKTGIDSNRFDHYGSFIGGLVGSLFSLVSVLLLIKTLKEQQKQQIEARFFELLRLHREHVDKLEINGKKGIACFQELVSSFKSCNNYLKSKFSEDNLDEPTLLNLSYLAFFFGTFFGESETSLRPILKEVLKKEELIQKIFQFVTGDFWGKWLDPQKDESDSVTLLSYGYRDILGHYWRHLFHTVQFVNSQSYLNYSEKYHLIKTLRVQMSDEEELLLFFNSLSSLGKSWEKGVNQEDLDNHLITKYNLIKNIPEGLWPKENLRIYYPNVEYQGDEFPQYEKQVMIRKYK